MKTRLVATTLLTVCAVARAAPEPAPAAPDKDPTPPAEKKMKADAPMKAPMAREGTMMGDVRENALKKDAAMKEMLKQEEMKQPAAPK